MREPYQVLSIPYKIIDGEVLFCIFKRVNGKHWQFIIEQTIKRKLVLEKSHQRKEIDTCMAKTRSIYCD